MDRYLKKIKISSVLKRFLYARVIIYSGIQVLLNGFTKKGLEISNLSIENKILNKLRKKYKKIILDYKKNIIINSASHSNIIWICWFQGLNNSPKLVQECFKSINNNIRTKKIVLLTENNYKDYVKFPDYIYKKVDSGLITKTHLSDLIRIELLTTIGGTWIDATVFCSNSNIQDYLLESDLFMFQKLKPSLSGHPTRISSWFMTANSNSNILNLTKILLYSYWKKNNYMVTYFLLHDFVELSIEAFPEEWNKVVKESSGNPHILQYTLNKELDDELLDYSYKIMERICFHKLSYKEETIEKNLKNVLKEF